MNAYEPNYSQRSQLGFCLPEESPDVKFAPPQFTPGYHSSGHMSGPELIELVRAIEPEIVIPVHTEKGQLFAEKLGEEFRVILPKDGETLEISQSVRSGI